jgi:hypothetical protein
MNLRVPWNAGNFLTSCKPVSCSGRTLHHGVRKYYQVEALYNLSSGSNVQVQEPFKSVSSRTFFGTHVSDVVLYCFTRITAKWLQTQKSDLLLAWKNFSVEDSEGKVDVVHLHRGVFVSGTLCSRRQSRNTVHLYQSRHNTNKTPKKL